MSTTINVLTTREEQFKELAVDSYSFCFNEDIDDYEFNIIDFNHCDDFDEDFIFTNCLYFSDNLLRLREEGFNDIKPSFFTCCSFEELPIRIKSFVAFAEESSQAQGETIYKKQLRSSKEINPIIEESLDKLGLEIEHLKSRYILVMQEILSNSIYNSPVDDMGNPIFRYVNRENEVVLDEGKEVEIEIIDSDDEIVISCRDQYGSLLGNTIKNYLFKELITPEKKEGGAGIGLCVIFDNANSLHFNLHLDKHTHFWVTMRKQRQFKKFLNSSKEVFIKEKRDF